MKTSTSRRLFLVPYLLWIVLFVVTPIVLVGYYSFFDIEGNFTLGNYVRFFEPVYVKMVLSSFWYAFLTTLFSFLVAFPAAYLLVRLKHRQLWLLLIILPTWINLLLKTYAFIGIFAMQGGVNHFLEFIGVGTQQLLFTSFSFVFVSVYIFIPFMLLPIYNALEKLNPSYVFAAQDLGASRMYTFRRIILPLVSGGIKAGCMVVFIPALSLFMITRLIAGNQVVTLGTAIEQHFLVTQDWGMGATIGVFLILAMVLMMVFMGGDSHVGGESR